MQRTLCSATFPNLEIFIQKVNQLHIEGWKTVPDTTMVTANGTREIVVLTLERLGLAPGSELVLIPGGDFMMGEGNQAHRVHVDSFYLSKYEVTNLQWQQFVEASPEWGKDQIRAEYHDGDYLDDWSNNTPPAGKEDHPVVYVSWFAAQAYCKWMGGRLPTEAEWEYAAQGGKGYKHGTSTGELGKELANYGSRGTTEVGSFPPNPFGIYDLSGNVWEWCSSEYKPYPYQAGDGREDLQADVRRVVRGGSWFSYVYSTRARYRNDYAPVYSYYGSGLRCARTPRP